MHGQADHIRALLGSGDEAQQAQARELLRALGDGALYAAILDGWAWESESRSLRWRGDGDRPFDERLADKIWLDAPLDAPFPPPLALNAPAQMELSWPSQAPQLRKLAALPRLREVDLYVDADSPAFPFSSLPRRVRILGISEALRSEDLAGLEASEHLSSLSLWYCALPRGALSRLPKVMELVLGSCSGDFDPGAELAEIPLRSLRLYHLAYAGSLAAMTSLRALGLIGMEGGLPSGLDALRDLRALTLSRSGLEDLPTALLDLPRLRSLSLSGNRLAGDLSRLARLSGLRGLDLSDNHLSSVPPEIGQLSELRSLRLESNRLKELPSALASLRSLRELDISSTRLRLLPPWLPELGRLEVLDISNLRIEDEPVDLLLSLPRLRTLRVDRHLQWLGERLAERAWAEQGRRVAVERTDR